MDWQGQKRAEALMQIMLLVSAIAAFGTGYAIGSFQMMMLTYAGGVVLTALVTVPNWPFFNRHPLKWLDSSEAERHPKPQKPSDLIGEIAGPRQRNRRTSSEKSSDLARRNRLTSPEESLALARESFSIEIVYERGSTISPTRRCRTPHHAHLDRSTSSPRQSATDGRSPRPLDAQHRQSPITLAMDWQGQKRAEALMQIMLLVSAIATFGIGYTIGSFQMMMLTYAGGVVLTALVTVPNWPFFNRHPLKWLDSSEAERHPKPQVNVTANSKKKAPKHK
ncbi:putative signal peptidase complex subunit 1 [Canna indica]|uniref:Signal peptidase complex subunit 1 n=1 Tax=Canna indica TaxID=4628 RepID=A0AAQ3KAU2_9LILI|nr:putative signal peptidase complex subunit 1 [Canna indica]